MIREMLQSIGLELQNKLKMKKIVLLFLLVSFGLSAQNNYKNWSDIVQKNQPDWFGTEEAKKIAENILLYQRDIGG
jgi:pectinesterase